MKATQRHGPTPMTPLTARAEAWSWACGLLRAVRPGVGRRKREPATPNNTNAREAP